MPNIKRIYLLSDAEFTDLYMQPDFNSDERKLYFTLNKNELDILHHYSNTRTRIYFILQLGYFKAKQQFFKFKFEEVRTDVEYIFTNCFPDTKTVSLTGQISRNYIAHQKNAVLKLFDYQDWSSSHKSQIKLKIRELLRYYPKVHNAMRQVLGYLDNQRIVIPTYRKLQDMFTAAYSAEEKRLSAIISSIPKSKKTQLSALINRDAGISQLNIIRAEL